jgi:hypothetical protein
MKQVCSSLFAYLFCIFLGCQQANPPEVQATKSSPYYQWKTEDLVQKYCDNATWQFDGKTSRVEMAGTEKKSGKPVVMRFHVIFGHIDKSNTKEDWIVLRESVSVGGKEVEFGDFFVDEYQKMNVPGK